MSRKYKFHNHNSIYFISFSTVYWIDVFTRNIYFETMTNALKYCRENKGMKIHGYCIMPSHIHLLFQTDKDNPSNIIRDLKTFTSKTLVKQIMLNPQESRKDWLLWMFKKAGIAKTNILKYQFWQHHNHPIEIHSEKFLMKN